MGVAASTVIAGAAVASAAASTAGAVISSRNQAKAQKEAARNQAASIADLARIRTELGQQALEGTFLGRFGLNDLFGSRPDEVDVAQSVRNASFTNLENLQANRNLVNRVNTLTSEDAIERASILDPNFRENVTQLSDSARALLAGEIPDDVLGQINRNRAESGAAGVGGGIGNQRAATARDLGLTSLDLQQRGASLFQIINQAREQVDPQSRQVALSQFLLTPEQQLQADVANNINRNSPDPGAQQLFVNEFQGSREEAFARGNVTVPVNNALGAGLSGAGGALAGLIGSGAFGSSGSSGPTPVVPAKVVSNTRINQFGQPI